MYRFGLLVALVTALLTVSCRSSGQESQPTPTAFPQALPPQRVTTAAPIPISLENLASNPDFFVGATLQLSGQYQPLPIVSCDKTKFASPATWGLVSDGYLANASGMDSQLRSLINEGQDLVVEGRWLKFSGPVGCGTAVEDKEIWYLSIDRVIDPHPLVREDAAAPSIAEAPPAVVEGESVTTEAGSAAEPPEALPTETPPPSATAFAAAPTVTLPSPFTSTPLTAETPTIPPSASPTTTATAAPQENSTGTPTVTPTTAAGGSAGQASATPSPSPAASSTATGSAIVEEGELDAEDLVINTLGANSADRWTLNLAAGEVVTITAVPAQTTNVRLTLFDSNGVSLASEQDNSTSGGVTTLSEINTTEPGQYTVSVESVQGTATDYALMFLDSESYGFEFRGRIANSGSSSAQLPADTDHFWFFNVNSGESVSLTVTPDDNSDPYLELFDPNGARKMTIDDGDVGESESLSDLTLLEGGLYGLRVAEFDFQPMSYQISLSRS